MCAILLKTPVRKSGIHFTALIVSMYPSWCYDSVQGLYYSVRGMLLKTVHSKMAAVASHLLRKRKKSLSIWD